MLPVFFNSSCSFCSSSSFFFFSNISFALSIIYYLYSLFKCSLNFFISTLYHSILFLSSSSFILSINLRPGKTFYLILRFSSNLAFIRLEISKFISSGFAGHEFCSCFASAFLLSLSIWSSLTKVFLYLHSASSFCLFYIVLLNSSMIEISINNRSYSVSYSIFWPWIFATWVPFIFIISWIFFSFCFNSFRYYIFSCSNFSYSCSRFLFLAFSSLSYWFL